MVHIRDGSHPAGSLKQNCVSSGYGSGYPCLVGRKPLSHGIQTGNETRKINSIVKVSRERIHMHVLVRDNKWADPSNLRAGRRCFYGPAYIKPASHDEPGRVAAHRIKN